jgi:hypothetical protein
LVGETLEKSLTVVKPGVLGPPSAHGSADQDFGDLALFGGLAFMVAGHMAVSASGHGGLLLRVDPAQTEALIADPRASRFAMRGREMDGWIRVAIDAHGSDDELNRWLKYGVD